MASSHTGSKWVSTTQSTLKSAFSNTSKPTPKTLIPHGFKRPKPPLLAGKPPTNSGNEIGHNRIADNKPLETSSNTNNLAATTDKIAAEQTASKAELKDSSAKVSAPESSAMPSSTKENVSTTPANNVANQGNGNTPNGGVTQGTSSTLKKMLGFVGGYFTGDNSTSEKKEETTISEAGLAPRFDVTVVKGSSETKDHVTVPTSTKEFQIKE